MDYDKIWEQNYHRLGEFVAKHDRMPSEKEKNIYNWISYQRKLFEKNKLSEERIEKLESIYYWLWDPRTSKWEESYNKLATFIKEHGHMPNLREAPKIWKWVRQERDRFRLKKLKKWQIDLLEKIDGWPDGHLVGDDWQKKYNQLKKHIKEKTEPNIDLLLWSKIQQTKHHNGKLSKHQINMLEALKNWTWYPKSTEEDWNKNYLELIKYIYTNGTLPDVNGDAKLYIWMEDQRLNYSAELLDGKKICQLESLNIWVWKPNKKRKLDQVTEIENISHPKKIKTE